MAAGGDVVVVGGDVSLTPNQITLCDKSSNAVVTVETELQNAGKQMETVPKRVPKRILHFSDGTLEEFSSDEEEEVDADINRNVVTSQAMIEPANVTWGPYIWYKITYMGNRTLAVCDYFGEHLANFFGITTPKYQFEVEDYFRKKAEEEKERQQRDIDLKNWTSPTIESETVAVQPGRPEWERFIVNTDVQDE